jgi:PAS domain S-box-containing protein
MTQIDHNFIKNLLNCINLIIDGKASLFDKDILEFKEHPGIYSFLNKLKEKVNSNFFSYKEIETFINKTNDILLEYAQHKYGNSVELTGDDILDSLITSVDFLGQELNYSTVTTHYLNDVFNSIGDLLLVVDEKGNILYISGTTCKMLEYKVDDLKNKNIQMILDTDVDFNFILKNKKNQSQYIFVTKNGKRIPVELKLSDFARQDNPMMGQVIIARDISVHLKYQNEIEQQNKLIKKTNEELREALKVAEQSEKLKTSFLANMSHEIRTPLNGIMGFSEYIQRPNLSQNDYKKFGNIILDCSNQLLGIVNDVLDISRIESGLMVVNSEPVMINKLLENIYTIYSQKIISEQKEIKLSMVREFKDDESYIISDELRLRQILSNLLDNAVKYTDSGEIIFGYRQQNDTLQFFVKDSGIGIPEDKHDSIFKPFHQAIESTTKLYGGTGLGLAIAKGLTKLLEGKIYFTSQMGVGSEFIFILPYQKTVKTIPKTEEEPLPGQYQWDNKSILIVEDDMYSSKYLEMVLRDSGARLKMVTHAEEAVKLVSANHFDVVLMDIRLPDIDGITATKKIRDFNTKVPIIAQTAYASTEDKLKCLQAGCNYYVPKPVNRALLMSIIDSLFGQKKHFAGI